MCQLLDAGLSVEGVRVGKSALTILGRYGEGSTELKYLISCFQEKLLKICYKYLYREPTQVVKERILR